MVEFALVAPLFFFALFSVVSGGLLMYAVNAAAQSADVGMVTLADEGTTPSADIDAITNIRSAGLGVTAIDSIDEIDIYMLAECQGQNPVPVLAGVSCSGKPDGTLVAALPGDVAHYNQNCYNGSCLSGGSWTPAKRHDSIQQGITNIGVTIRYHFNYVGVNNPTARLSETRFFRIEPKTA